MAANECFIIGQAVDFNSEKITALAEKAGLPETLDSCDIDKTYGVTEIMTEQEMLAFFKDNDGKPHTGKVLDQRLEFLDNYTKIAISGDPFMRTLPSDNLVGFFKAFFPDVFRLHKKYKVPYFENEADIYVSLLKKAVSSAQDRGFNELFMLGCQNTELPEARMSVALAATLFSYSLLGKASLDLPGFVKMYDDCMAVMSAERKPLFMDRLKALNFDRFIENARLKLKENNEIKSPEIRKTIKGNKATVFFGWASWCPNCIKAMPTLGDIATKMRKKGVGIVGVVGYKDDTFEEIAKHRKENKVTWKDIDLSEADRKLFPEALPFFVVVNKNGVVKKVIVGVIPGWEKELEDAISSCL